MFADDSTFLRFMYYACKTFSYMLAAGLIYVVHSLVAPAQASHATPSSIQPAPTKPLANASSTTASHHCLHNAYTGDLYWDAHHQHYWAQEGPFAVLLHTCARDTCPAIDAAGNVRQAQPAPGQHSTAPSVQPNMQPKSFASTHCLAPPNTFQKDCAVPCFELKTYPKPHSPGSNTHPDTHPDTQQNPHKLYRSQP